MQIKVGDTWYDAKPGQPIMVRLSNGDKRNIANMAADEHLYAVFHDEDKTTETEKRLWMKKKRG